MMDKKRKKETGVTKVAKKNKGIFGIGARTLSGRAAQIEAALAGNPPKYKNK